MKKLLSTVGLLGLTLGAAVGQPPEPTPLVQQLIQQLGSEDFRTREKATADLENAGPAAIVPLRTALKSDDPEIRLRAAAILQKLQRAADSAERLTAPRLALDYQNVPLGVAFNDFRHRSGLPLTLDARQVADPFRRVTLRTGELPVWEALDAFCRAAGLQEQFCPDVELPKMPKTNRHYALPPIVPTAHNVPMVLVDDDGHSPRPLGDRRTAVRVLVLPPAFPGHRIQLGGEVTLCCDITPAPGVPWQGVATVKIHKLIDEAGRSGSGTCRLGSEEWAFGHEVVAFAGGRGAFLARRGVRIDATGHIIPIATLPNPRIVPLSLKLDTPRAKRLQRLEGAVVGEITAANQPLITVKEPTRSVGHRFEGPGDVQLNIQAFHTRGDHHALQLELAYPPPWLQNARRGRNPGGIWPEAPQPTSSGPTVRLHDATGSEIPAQFTHRFLDTVNNDERYVQTFSLVYAKNAGLPAQLVVMGTRSWVVEVPFVLENVPLP